MELKEIWKGRIDGENLKFLRWHQVVKNAHSVVDFQHNFVFTGFCCDEGVRRNKGRIGAKNAPNFIRNCCSNFPILDEDFKIYDNGNVYCEDSDLEKAQQELAEKVKFVLINNGKSLVLGGGHEVAFAHFSGIRKAFPTKKIGIINFDAHFDNRTIEKGIGATSGTGFYQMAELEKIHSLTIGIQRNSNTNALFDYADNKGMNYILADDIQTKNIEKILHKIVDFISKVDVLYVTVCMDIFSSAFAPGVSSTAYSGIFPDAIFKEILKKAISSEKLLAFDIAEVNPDFDIDNRTAKLAASLIFEVLNCCELTK